MFHVHAYEYFGGVARLLIPDNLKTGVITNTRYETRLNESFRELAEYYSTAVVPARVRKPQDKSIVEKSVGFSTTWITAAMRERKFFSLAEVKTAVAERLEIINTTPFQKRPGNRREAYLNEEKEFMLPLPRVPYEPAVWKQATVRNDYDVEQQEKYRSYLNAIQKIARIQSLYYSKMYACIFIQSFMITDLHS